MRYLGIDYGDKKVGLALSDQEGILGMPYKTIRNENLLKKIKEIIKNENVEFVVLGLPLNLKMQETEQTKKVYSFLNKLKKHIKVPIVLENEFLTSSQAKKSGAKGEDVDSSSAALILQSYLDYIQKNER